MAALLLRMIQNMTRKNLSNTDENIRDFNREMNRLRCFL